MLKAAQPYQYKLKELEWGTAYNERYKYYHMNYFSEINLPADTWTGHYFVSVDSNDQINGFMGYDICNRTHHAFNFMAICFKDEPSIEFARDLFQMIDNVFCKYNFTKMSHSVIVGNPAEKAYDRLHKRYGGRIVGVFENECKLITGEIADKKYYEIKREDYLKNRRHV